MADAAKQEATMLLAVTRQSKQVKQGNSEEVARQQVQQDQDLMKMSKAAESNKPELAKMDKIKSARAAFSPEEADVFSSGDEVVIRLKSLDFPVSKSTIPSSEFPLLNKVATVLQDFEGSQVKIEGHTDSKGSADVNKKISKQRAESVKDYLVANEAVAAENVSVAGKGYSEPIASNKSSKGRALNRRVDIVISDIG